jgi:hypothetical protein
MLIVVTVNVVILIGIMLSVFMLSVVMLSSAAKFYKHFMGVIYRYRKVWHNNHYTHCSV